MKKILSLILLVLISSLSLMGCPSKKSPMSPTAPPAGPTSTSTPIPGIYWQTAYLYGYDGYANTANLTLTVNGQAVTNVLAVITGGTAPVTLTYTNTLTLDGIAYANYYSVSPNLNYTVGNNYTLTTSSEGVTASATLAAPGNIAIASNGSQATWADPGNLNSVWVVQNGSATVFNSGTAVASPFNLPTTVYVPGGAFTIWVDTDNTTTSVTGAASGSAFSVYYLQTGNVTVNNPTPTPTNLSSYTSTPSYTLTITPTSTNLSGYTSTFTPSLTWTPTFSDTATPSPSNTPTDSPTFTLTATTTYSPTHSPTATPTATATTTPTSTNTTSPTYTWTPQATPTFALSWSSSSEDQFMAYSSVSGGIIYVADFTSQSILRYNTASAPLASFGSGPSTIVGQFHNPSGVAADSAGNVFVTETVNNRVQELDSTGSPVWALPTGGVTTIGSGNGQFHGPVDLALDGSDHVFVSDNGNSRIVELTTSGSYVTAWTCTNPTGIAFNSANSYLYVACNAYYVKVFDTSGNLINQWGGQGTGPGQFRATESVAVNSAGTMVYVTDVSNNNVQAFDTSGNYLDSWGGSGSGNYLFGSFSPLGITVDSGGKVYVDDPGNSLIKVYGP